MKEKSKFVLDLIQLDFEPVSYQDITNLYEKFVNDDISLWVNGMGATWINHPNSCSSIGIGYKTIKQIEELIKLL